VAAPGCAGGDSKSHFLLAMRSEDHFEVAGWGIAQPDPFPYNTYMSNKTALSEDSSPDDTNLVYTHRFAKHLVIRVDHTVSNKEGVLEDVLNKHGEDGWELVSVLDRAYCVQLYMKKISFTKPKPVPRGA